MFEEERPILGRLPKGIILRSKFPRSQARYVFLYFNQQRNEVTVMPFRMDKKQAPCKIWKTNSIELFRLAEENEQFGFAWEHFDMERYLKFIEERLHVPITN